MRDSILTKPNLLYVDDRPSTLTQNLIKRTDVEIILLRFSNSLQEISKAHEIATLGLKTFIFNESLSLNDNVKRFYSWQHNNNIFATHFLNPSEPRQFISNLFANKLNLPSLTEQQVKWLRNKLHMKNKLLSLGFNVAPFREVNCIEDVILFGKELGWPIIVKPIEGYACIDTFKIKNPDQITTLPLTRFNNFMAEQFIHATEYECCALIYNGSVLDVYLSWFPAPPLSAANGAINGNISMRESHFSFDLELKNIIQRIIDGMNIDHGYLHMEFFRSSKRKIWISEVALRLAGCEIPANHSLAYGFNIFNALINIHIGKRPELNYMMNRFVGDLLLPVKDGYVEFVTPIEELLSIEGVIDGRLKICKGQYIKRQQASHSSSGFVHIEGKNVYDVFLKMKKVLKHFILITS